MIKIDDIKKLMECTILTGFIKPDRQDKITSLLIVADVESGKSELIKTMRSYPNTCYTNDLSFKGLIDEILPKVEQDLITHILIPDLINVLSHRRASDTLFPHLNSIMEGELRDIKFYGSSKTFSKDIMAGLVVGTTKHSFEQKLKSWRNNGFLSRILPLTFAYSEMTRLEIDEAIKFGTYTEPEKAVKDFKNIKPHSFTVNIPLDVAKQIQIMKDGLLALNEYYVLGRTVGGYKLQLQKYGFRLHKQLRTLIKGICLYNAQFLPNVYTYEVTENDFNDLMTLSKFMNFKFNEI